VKDFVALPDEPLLLQQHRVFDPDVRKLPLGCFGIDCLDRSLDNLVGEVEVAGLLMQTHQVQPILHLAGTLLDGNIEQEIRLSLEQQFQSLKPGLYLEVDIVLLDDLVVLPDL
jgi:hypothetical protein